MAPDTKKTPAHTSLAVVICTKDRPSALVKTLESLWTQSRLPDELLIIDDGTLPGDLVADIKSKCRRKRVKWIYHHKDQPGLTRSRNIAADLARSDVLVYLDDDVSCAANLLAEISELMSDPRVGALSPIVHEPAFEGFSSTLYQWGYRLAGWWQVGPRQISTSPPRILQKPQRAGPLRWLSGAALAIRREIVLAERFDENLTQYALGEDREMGYRIASRHWLIEARATNVIHRREAGGRIDHYRLGFMTSHNYLYILNKTCRLGLGNWIMIAWSLCVLAVMHLLWGIRRKHHFQELLGMIAGVRKYFGLGSQRHLAPSALRTPLRSKIQDPKPKVLFVTTDLRAGGAELMLVSLVRHLRPHHIEPIILSLKEAGPLAATCREHGIKVYEQFLRHKTDTAVISRIRDLLVQEAIDIVTIAHSGGDRMFWATLAAKSINRPVVVWSHWFPRPGLRHFERPNRVLLRSVDAFVALGDEHRKALIRHEQVPSGRIHVIANGLELDRFSPSGRQSARTLLHLRKDQLAVGIVANLRTEKRHDVFIEAARQLHQRRPDLRFFIIGDGPNRDVVLTAGAASGLSHDVLRILGARDDVAALLPGLDISCLCSEIECFSVTMLEAAASGCAFIGPNAGCMPEFIEDGVTGLLIRPANVPDLVTAIDRLAGDPDFRILLATAARRRVCEHYSLAMMAEKFASLFFAVRKNPPSSRMPLRPIVRSRKRTVRKKTQLT